MQRSEKLARFGQFELDARTGELRANGNGPVQLAEQPLQILLALLECPGELISRDELQKRLWPNNTVVEFEHSISAAMNRLRKALGDSAENPKYIETLARRGYRWKGQVEWRGQPGSNGEATSEKYSGDAIIANEVKFGRRHANAVSVRGYLLAGGVVILLALPLLWFVGKPRP